MSLVLLPISLEEANAFVAKHHRHHRRVQGHKFSLAACDLQLQVRGVAIVGRPVSRVLDNGFALEVTRCCTDGTPNACSFLYGAARRAAKTLGYKRIITYTLATETGASLRAAGWRLCGESKGGSWSRRGRPRVTKHPTEKKLIWEALLSVSPPSRLCVESVSVPPCLCGKP